MRTGWLVVCLAVGCYTGSPPKHPDAPPSAPVETPRRIAPSAETELYALDDALADALSGPWTHIGSGEWFGMFRMNACAYRNARVIVVNIYCTTKEMVAFGLVVLSPTRGRAFIYAEAKAPISKLTRADYFTFKAESEPVIADDRLPPLRLTFSRAELRAWDELRYKRDVPGCFGGVEMNRPQSGCMSELKSHATAWAKRNTPFLDQPPADWYRIVKMLRVRAASDAVPVAP